MSLLTYIDNSSVDELDPSLVGGYALIFNHEIPFELRVQNSNEGPQQVGTLEAVRVKILTLGSGANLKCMRIEMSSDTDLFFHYSCVVSESDFQTLQDRQKLLVDYFEYPGVVEGMLASCASDPTSHLAVFVVTKTAGRLDVIQNAAHKFLELASLDFAKTAVDVVQAHVSFRYNTMKTKLELVEGRLQEVNNLIKDRNPELLKQLAKTHPRGASGAGAARR